MFNNRIIYFSNNTGGFLMDKKRNENINKYRSEIYKILDGIESEKILVTIYTYIKHVTQKEK